MVLTATFLALASGGVAACDASDSEEWESSGDSSTYVYESSAESDSSDYSESFDGDGYVDDDMGELGGSDESDEFGESGDEIFYCADEDGEIVDEDLCDDPDPVTPVFLWHSTGYARGMSPGMSLDGGDSFPATDRSSRRAFSLPATGHVANGAVKTNVVGRSSGGSSVVKGTSSGG
ncbi:hypothetical protein [Actinoplanes rectilineatus]|uniref:hypothetical protein n=1 Tax=Actinoplanes rectilineatus TaxID=113571 RepID=UPI00147031A2|nr:hypothetical protein [Actinoplanes rectilineatus]